MPLTIAPESYAYHNFRSSCCQKIEFLLDESHTLHIARMKNARAKVQAGDVGHRQARVIEGRPIRVERNDLTRQLRKVFGVNRLLPTVLACFFCRDPRVLLPPLVHELVRTMGDLHQAIAGMASRMV